VRVVPLNKLPNRPCSAPKLAPRWVLTIVLMVGGAVGLGAAPPYALSGYAPQLEQITVAETPMGPVSALDVLMFDALTDRQLEIIPFEVWMDLDSMRAEPYTWYIGQTVEELATTAELAGRAGSWQPAPDALRARSFGAAVAAWVDAKIKPLIKVEQIDIDRYYLANPELYIQRRTARVRYIFLKFPPDAPTAMVAGVRNDLDEIAIRIRQEELTFEEAARHYSDAPSAAEGGLLPRFYERTYFKDFEERVFLLDQPGQMTEVFTGPGGVYLIQLVESKPASNIPLEAVRENIREKLQIEHIRHYYQFEMEKIHERCFVRNHVAWFEGLNLDVPLASVGRVELSRPDFLRFYDNPLTPFFEVNWPLVTHNLAAWIEGEVIMQELAKEGITKHRWLTRARELAALHQKAQHVYAQSVPAQSYATPEIALETLKRNPDFVANLRSVNLIQFEIAPKGGRSVTQSEKRAARRLARVIDNNLAQGALITAPIQIDLAQWREELIQAVLARGSAPAAAVDSANPTALPDMSLNPQQPAVADPTDPTIVALENLNNAIKATLFPNVEVTALPIGWRSTVPGSGWDTPFLGVAPGQMSRPLTLGDVTRRYLVLGEQPLDVQPWLEKPLYLQVLAFRSVAHGLYQETLDRMLAEGRIQYKVPIAELSPRMRFALGGAGALPPGAFAAEGL